MATERQRYLAYMLRLWQTGEDEMAWRASLENPHTRERVGFDSTEALYEHIQHCIDNPEPNHEDERQAPSSPHFEKQKWGD